MKVGLNFRIDKGRGIMVTTAVASRSTLEMYKKLKFIGN